MLRCCWRMCKRTFYRAIKGKFSILFFAIKDDQNYCWQTEPLVVSSCELSTSTTLSLKHFRLPANFYLSFIKQFPVGNLLRSLSQREEYAKRGKKRESSFNKFCGRTKKSSLANSSYLRSIFPIHWDVYTLQMKMSLTFEPSSQMNFLSIIHLRHYALYIAGHYAGVYRKSFNFRKPRWAH